MDVLTRLANSIVVPVVVLDKAEDAVPTAKAMAAGGVDTMEITFRTACAPDAIRAVAENCPDVLVGAGTIVNLDQCKLAIEMGAKFIVSPGFSDEIVGDCAGRLHCHLNGFSIDIIDLVGDPHTGGDHQEQDGTKGQKFRADTLQEASGEETIDQQCAAACGN